MSDLAKGDLTSQHRCYADGIDPKLLDVVTIQFLEPSPQGCQKENHRIDSGVRRAKLGTIGWNELAPAVDNIAGELWRNGDSSSNGLNDRIPEKVAEQLPSSLLLIEPEACQIVVAKEGGIFKPARKKVRGRFRLKGHDYLLAVTDLPVEDQYARKDEGDYPIQGARLCISIGEPYHGYCYKLIAAVITPERARN